MPEALPELVWFALLLFCFAFVWAARKLIAALLSPVISLAGSIPLVGSGLTSLLRRIEQDVDHALGTAEAGIDKLMGSSWHRFAELNEWLWREFKRHTLIGQLTAALVSRLTHAFEHLHGIAHRALAVAESIPHRVKQLDREFRGIEHRVKSLERDFTRGIGHDVLPRLRSLDKEVAHLEGKVIPSLRTVEGTLAGEIGNLYDWAKGKASLIGVGTFATAVAAALAALGLDWLKCREAQNVFNKRGCGMWNDLDALLGLFAAVVVIEDYRTLVKLAQTIEHEAAVGIQDVLKV